MRQFFFLGACIFAFTSPLYASFFSKKQQPSSQKNDAQNANKWSRNDWFSCDIGVGGGYRQDAFKLTIHDPLNPDDPGLSKPIIVLQGENIRSPSIEAFVKMFLFKYLFLRGDFDYAWPVSGDVHLDALVIFGAGLNQNFSFDTSVRGGSFYDLDGSIGLSINLLPRKIDQKLLVIPQGGYSKHYQNIKAKQTALQSEILSFGPVGTLQPNLGTYVFKRTWWGPFVGFDLSTDPDKCFCIEAGYFYHFLKYKHDQSNTTQFRLFGAGDVDFFLQVRETMDDAYAHQVRGRVVYCIIPQIKLGLSGNYYYMNGIKNRSAAFQTDGAVFGVPDHQKRAVKLTQSTSFFDVFLDLTAHY